MVKLIIEINEEISEKTDSLDITGVEVRCTEIGKKATKGERYTSNLLKERMHIDKKEEIVNKITKSKKEILEQLLKSL